MKYLFNFYLNTSWSFKIKFCIIKKVFENFLILELASKLMLCYQL